ncbi:hypothetical protein DSO57_1017235 [Entomophthora muscae]|uniref:Uncharacterized protein n=1 Tax=Entomophthora muscae TaxID=34485 RepID=A0ACC2SU15_9FUNG|nr:hypothetical protein DSO57_1017235 [Entomophthora muscae]
MQGDLKYYMLATNLLNYRPWVSGRELPYTALAVLWFLVCAYIVCLANSYMDINNPSVAKKGADFYRLPDILIDLAFPTYKKWELPDTLPDTLVQVSTVFIFIRVLLGGQKAMLLLRRVLYTCGIVYLVRAPFIIMTVLPNPLEWCMSEPNPNHFYDALLLMAQVRYSCGDVLYSGHTIIFMICCLVWHDYSLFNNAMDHLIKAIAIMWGLFCLLILVISSYHYTVDVVVALLIVLFTWKAFYCLATTNIFDDTLASRIVLFFDQERYTYSCKHPTHNIFPA